MSQLVKQTFTSFIIIIILDIMASSSRYNQTVDKRVAHITIISVNDIHCQDYLSKMDVSVAISFAGKNKKYVVDKKKSPENGHQWD